MKRIVTRAIFLLSLAALGSSCGPNQRILESANANQETSEPVAVDSKAAPSASSFEQDLDAMRTADFKFIVAFRRRDGRPMDANDKEILGKTISQANRRRLSDDGRAVIIGSNFPFVTGAFDPLTERFKMEDYSKPDSGSMFSNSIPNTH